LRKGEPVLNDKVTGPGQRASLSAVLTDGMKAVSIRVNDVIGVSGFVLPGDRVDIVLTRTIKDKPSANGKDTVYNEVMLQNVRVLAVDQTSDPKVETPKIVRTVTVETNLADAQKIILGSTVGELSLILRDNAAAKEVAESHRINADDLGDNGEKGKKVTPQPPIAIAPVAQAMPNPQPETATAAKAKVQIYRAAASSEYSVIRWAAKD
jgi:pilus assembly protein CpaB